MKIESIIPRPRGTIVTLDGVDYHFKPELPGHAHVAEVEDPAHIDTFLAIPEGFRKAGKAARTVPVESETPNDSQVLQGEGGAGEAGGSDEPPAKPRAPRKPRAPQDAEAKETVEA